MAAKDNQASQLGFLSLPREIRDQIYLELSLASSKAPNSPEKAGPRVEDRMRGGVSYFYSAGVEPQYAFQGLLNSNRQIARELRQQGPLDARLDVMLEFFKIKTGTWTTWTRIWPTWTLYPGPMDDIRELQIDLGLHKMDLIRVDEVFQRPGVFVNWPLYILLNRFFHHGPQFVYKGPYAPKVHVGTLKITVFSRDSPEYIHSHSGRYPEAPPERIVKSVFRYFASLAKAGTFSGQISRILVCGGTHQMEIESAILPDISPSVKRSLGISTVRLPWGPEPSSDNPMDVV